MRNTDTILTKTEISPFNPSRGSFPMDYYIQTCLWVFDKGIKINPFIYFISFPGYYQMKRKYKADEISQWRRNGIRKLFGQDMTSEIEKEVTILYRKTLHDEFFKKYVWNETECFLELQNGPSGPVFNWRYLDNSQFYTTIYRILKNVSVRNGPIPPYYSICRLDNLMC